MSRTNVSTSSKFVNPGATMLVRGRAKTISSAIPKLPRQKNKIRDDAESFPAAISFTAFEILKEDRDEHDRQRTSCQQVVQKIRQRKAGKVEVRLSAST